jgi:predicted DNA-binding ribbon-helix-helix protein
MSNDDDMPAEIDFSKGERGKFHQAGARLRMPIHLEASVQDTLASIANARGMDLSALVNDLLKKDIELIRMAR